MSLRLRVHASTGFYVGLNRVLEFWLNVTMSDHVDSLVLTEMSSDWMVVIVL